MTTNAKFDVSRYGTDVTLNIYDGWLSVTSGPITVFADEISRYDIEDFSELRLTDGDGHRAGNLIVDQWLAARIMVEAERNGIETSALPFSNVGY